MRHLVTLAEWNPQEILYIVEKGKKIKAKPDSEVKKS